MDLARATVASRSASRAWATWSPALVAVFLGVVALLPRVLGLADFITTDEAYHWIARVERFSAAISDGRWAATNLTGHPGVTLMWLGSLGLALERAAVGHGWTSVPSPVEHLAWLRLPPALLQSLLIPAGYALLRRLVAPATALVAALLWATSPYMIAHARLLHLDALLTNFVTFSILLLLVATKDEGRRTKDEGQQTPFVVGPPSFVGIGALLASGACAGLALLTKGPALILLPSAGLLLFALTRDGGRRTEDEGTQRSFVLRLSSFVFGRLRLVVPRYLLWLSTAALVVALLWPALWADSAGAFRNYLDEIVSNGGRPNGVGQFFLGRPVADPGPLFYPFADLLRMTPVTLIGLLAYFGFTMYDLRLWRHSSTINRQSQIVNQGVLLALGAFALFWTLVMTLGPKKFDRYVLPTWPAIELLAAAGLVGLLDLLRRPPTANKADTHHAPRTTHYALRTTVLGSALVILGLLFTDFWYHPYYLSYYNPLLGGGAAAQRALLIGWGEGMDEVGAYLRAQPDIRRGPVLAALGSTLQPFVPAPVKDVTELGGGPANYAVVYIESIQRADNQPIYDAIRQTVPLHTISIHGIEYATIYQLPRPFERAIGVRWGEALRLRGVTIARTPGQLLVTPSWDVRATPAADYHVFLHLLASTGRRIAQVDVAPGGGDFPPTSAWQPGQQIAVPLPLALPADLPKGDYRLVMGLYNVATGERPPLTEGAAADAALDGPHAVLLDTISLP